MYKSLFKSLYLFVLVAFFFASPIRLHAQANTERMYEVGTIHQEDEATNEATQQFRQDLRLALQRKGKTIQENADVMFFVIAKPINDTQMAVSVSIMGKLPEAMVAWARKEQVFYQTFKTNVPEADKTPQSKEVREYVSERYIREFKNLTDGKIFVIQKAKYAETVEQIALDLLKQD